MCLISLLGIIPFVLFVHSAGAREIELSENALHLF